MKRLVTTFVIAGIISLTAVVWGQQGNGNGNDQNNGQGNAYAKGQDPFFDKNDDGETIKVLPTPASVHSDRDTEPSFATDPGNYPPSYGSGLLINHGGPQISNAKFYPIFWNSSVAGSTETSGNYTTLEQQVVTFVNSFSGSSSYKIINQYGPISDTIAVQGPKTRSEATKSSIRDSQIQSFLSGLFQANIVPPDSTAVYGIYFPPGMKIQLQGMSCSSFCGYHSHYSYGKGAKAQQIKYAVFPYLNCSACKLKADSIVADMLTIVTSHEIREAVTDPLLNAWFDAQGYEADDKCAWHNIYQMPGTSLWVQPEFSNADGGRCMVPGSPNPQQHATRR